MANKPEKVLKRFDKEALFDNFVETATEVLDRFEHWFKFSGARESFLGVKEFSKFAVVPKKQREAARDHVRESDSWIALSTLYDYAVDGIAGDAYPGDIVIGGAEVLSLITTENASPMAEWDMIVARGDGRFALDEGSDISLEKLTLLAEVDVRTVRNAISAGELIAYKRDELHDPGTYIENATARRWLQGRRGFKPTAFAGRESQTIDEIGTPSEFGAFLMDRRKSLGIANSDGKLVPLCPGVDTKALEAIEAGVFALPLNTINPIADFYQLDRKAFLNAVMRIFFSDHLATLRASLAND